jgi:hypothetical protein
MPKRFHPISPARMRSALNLAGLLILIAGLTSAAFIWRAHQNDIEKEDEQLANPAAPLALSDSRKQSRQIEIYYGKTGVLFERWSEKLQTLSHGKPLAKVIVVVSLITAASCFLTATRVPFLQRK